MQCYFSYDFLRYDHVLTGYLYEAILMLLFTQLHTIVKVTKQTCLEQMTRAGEAVTHSLRRIILGEIGVFEFLATQDTTRANV